MSFRTPQPLVSILIPAYNAEKYVAETIQSALGQTWPHKEIIVVDDGSSDDTYRIAKRFESETVKVVLQPNRGASAARNTAYLKSSGDYIQFLDADDKLSPNKIEIQLQRLLGLGQGYIASCAWGRFYGDVANSKFIKETLWADFTPLNFLVTAYNHALMMQPNVWLCPRAVIEKAGLWDERLSLNDDGEYFARVVLASKGICFCEDARVYYRSGISGSLASSKGRRAYLSALLSVTLCAKHLVAFHDGPETKKAAANLIQKFIYDTYPQEMDLITEAEQLVADYGKPSIQPAGPPRFKLLNRVLPWKIARQVEQQTNQLGLSKSRLSKISHFLR